MNKSYSRENVERLRRALDVLIDELDDEPKVGQVIDLLHSCQVIDAYYKHLCDETDHFDGVAEGTSYENGINIEFYIEASWWHEVSLALRALGKAPVEED